MSEYSFTYVLIPADTDKPPSELSATTTDFGDALSTILKSSFAGGEVKNADSLRAEYGSAVDENFAKLNLAAKQGQVEIFALVRPSETTRPVAHSGTYFYFDEMGVLKDLPTNHRAAQFAASCGLDVQSPFLGDVYIGRVAVKPSPMRNVNFELSELDSSSVFLRSAPSENTQYQMAMADYEKAAKAATAEATGRAARGGAAGSSKSLEPTGPGSYKYSQTADDVEVTVMMPEGTVKKGIKVDVGVKKLTVKAPKDAPKPLLELDFFATVRPDEMTWTFDQAKGQLAVMVEKQNGVHWPQLTPASEGQLC